MPSSACPHWQAEQVANVAQEHLPTPRCGTRSRTDGQLLFHLVSRLYERTSIVVTKTSRYASGDLLGDAKITIALLVSSPTIATRRER